MEYFIHVAILIMIYAILGISYNLLMGYTALFSLAHAAMFGIGAYASAMLSIKLGLNMWLALSVAIAITAASGAVIGIPALRVRSHYLVVLSFGFQMVIYSLMMNLVTFTGGEGGIVGIPKPSIFGLAIDTKWKYLITIGLIGFIVFLIGRRLGNSPFGRVLKAIRDDEEATRFLGKNILSFKVTIFMFSGALAAVAGGLYAHYINFINPFTFSLSESVFILAIVVFGGSGNLWGSVFGALILVAVPELLRFLRGFSEAIAGPFRQILYGLMLMVMMRFRPQGLIPEHSVKISKLTDYDLQERIDKKDETNISSQSIKWASRDEIPAKEREKEILHVQNLSKHFGGILALDRINLVLQEKKITGLIGPNGAGKTTLFNLITGLFPPDEGMVLLRGKDITFLPAHLKARLGMARTFQELRLFPKMTVMDTVLVARPNQIGERFFMAFLPIPSEEKFHRDKAIECLQFVGLLGKRNEITENLSYSEQKLLSLARLLATEAEILLLDEPTSGLDPNSISNILELIERLPERGKTVCIVEHNLDVIRRISDWIYFLAEGKVIAEGTQERIFSDPTLAEIYFGGR
jgi:branched-chain amino acid transport system permease protein